MARQLAYKCIAKPKQMNRVITRKEFKKEVVESRTLSLVQFKTEWNGACQIIAPVYNDLAKAYKGLANFFTVDFEKEKKLVIELGIIEAPTILFFRSGRVIDHLIGLAPKNILISKIENALTTNQN
ncbi:MAG TPA: thioredoxin domain-containing protein [Chitinophagaceae bacterium]|nr:thioredoxin domain-containing protein [Chitinophagaceae bacterium]